MMDEPLRKAVEAGSVEDIVTAVQGGANVNARDEGGETALTWATSIALGPERALACVRCLLSLGARVSEDRQADWGRLCIRPLRTVTRRL